MSPGGMRPCTEISLGAHAYLQLAHVVEEVTPLA